MKEKAMVDFQDVLLKGETAFVGRQNGFNYQQKLKEKNVSFKNLENEYQKIVIKIPENIISMNKSFFLALWAERVLELGQESFEKRYIFETSEHIKKKIKSHIQAALLTVPQKEILGV